MIAFLIETTTQSEPAENTPPQNPPPVLDENLPPPPPLPKDSQCIPLRVAPPKKYNNQGIGSMESYLLMKDQKKTLENEKKQTGDGGQTSHPQTLEETVETSTGNFRFS